MSYYNYQMSNPLQKRVKELQADKKELSQAIDDLNACYQEKINLLERTISNQQMKYEDLLEWKQEHINKSLFEAERYELEIKKMIQILDNAHNTFEREKQALVNQLQSQGEIIKDLKQENEALSQFNNLHESKIEEMVRCYNEQIDKLKSELKQLKEESAIEYQQGQSHEALREVTLNQNVESFEPNENSRIVIKGGQPAQSKLSIETVLQ